MPTLTAPINEITATASMWLSRRDRGMTASEQIEYLHWLQPSAPHRNAAAQLERMWEALSAEAIASLPEYPRQVLTLRKVYGLSQKQIAAQLGLPEPVIEEKLAVALHHCTVRFANRGWF
jgi:DNA-directed RNA polymerase specialized sigma24 family protein